MEPADNDDEDNHAPPLTDQEVHRPDSRTSVMKRYVVGLNAFTRIVNGMNWPDGFDLTKDQDLLVRMFRDFWRMRSRLQREEEQELHRNKEHFQGFDDQVDAFVQRSFARRFTHKHGQSTHIDSGSYQPEDEHETDDAKERIHRFRDEWA